MSSTEITTVNMDNSVIIQKRITNINWADEEPDSVSLSQDYTTPFKNLLISESTERSMNCEEHRKNKVWSGIVPQSIIDHMKNSNQTIDSSRVLKKGLKPLTPILSSKCLIHPPPVSESPSHASPHHPFKQLLETPHRSEHTT